MLNTTKPVAYQSLVLLAGMYAFMQERQRFPQPGEMCPSASLRGSAIRHFKRLEAAGLIARHGKGWDTGSFTGTGIERVSTFAKSLAGRSVAEHAPKRVGRQSIKRQLVPRQKRSHQQTAFRQVRRTFWAEDQAVTLTRREQEALYYIGQSVLAGGHVPSPNYVAREVYGKLTSHSRAHAIGLYVRLERLGLIARRVVQSGVPWTKVGYFTDLGVKIFPQVQKPSGQQSLSHARFGGGLAVDGGTLFKDTLFRAETLGTEGIVQFADRYSKIGHRVKKAADGGHQMGLKIATFSLEEGRTCSPSCGLRDVCYAGKMSRHRRVYYEGVKTDKAIAKAIAESGPMHWRINTVGDFPSESFITAVLVAVTAACSTAWGYTHWAPEHPLGYTVRAYSERYWNFFAIRTSYEHGSRDPLPERGAVIMREFDPKLLELHNAVPCPEQTGAANSCGECGLCWTTRRNVAFKLH